MKRMLRWWAILDSLFETTILGPVGRHTGCGSDNLTCWLLEGRYNLAKYSRLIPFFCGGIGFDLEAIHYNGEDVDAQIIR